MNEVTDPALLQQLNAAPPAPSAPPPGLKEVTDPATLNALNAGQATAPVPVGQGAPAQMSVFGTPLPPPAPPFGGQALVQGPPGSLETLDDTMRMVAEGSPLPASEIAAAANAFLGIGKGATFGERYAGNLEAERARNAWVEEREPGAALAAKVTGGVLSGGAAAKGGLTLLKGASPTLGSLATRGAAEGAIYGAAYGAKEGTGLEERAEGAAYGAGLGALGGGLTGAFFSAFLRKATPATLEAVKAESRAAYKVADDAGLIVKQNSFANAVEDIWEATRGAGIDKTIHPKATSALQRLQEAAAAPQGLQGLANLRRILKSAAASSEPDERRIAGLMIDKLDDWMTGLKPGDLLAGDKAAVAALTEARGLWSKFRKGEAVLAAIDRAGVRAGQFSGSGYENALRTEFRAIAMNAKKMRIYSTEEGAAIRKVAMGGKIENVLRFLGKFAPRGIVSATLGGGVGYSVAGPAGSAAVMGAGEIGRRGATAMTRASAEAAAQRMLTGKGPVTLTPEQAAFLSSLIVGENAAIAGGLDTP